MEWEETKMSPKRITEGFVPPQRPQTKKPKETRGFVPPKPRKPQKPSTTEKSESK
jgi:hypothetical protein